MNTMLLLLASFLAITTAQISVGDRLVRTYGDYIDLPIDAADAVNAGWTIAPDCDPYRGYAATYSEEGASPSYPITLFFNGAGQVAGVGVTIYGSVKDTLLDLGFFEEVAEDEYFVSVTFRNSTGMCSSSKLTNLPLGDRVVINAGGLGYHLPLLEKQAVVGNWTKGACFSTMGYHYFYDLATAPVQSWEAHNLLPVIPMYNNGVINAVFFASTSMQQSLLSSNWWEKIPLPNFLMCKNWCDPACGFDDTLLWSTMHIYLRDQTQVGCPGGCTISCCSS